MVKRPLRVLAAAAIPLEVQRILDTLQMLSTSVMVLAWVAVGIGWFTGWFKLALPIPSRRVKRSGYEEVEAAGLAAFFIAAFATILTLVLWIVKSVGTMAPPTL